jgi:peptidoglycan/LPS O-acetylase OafA/YrhL
LGVVALGVTSFDSMYDIGPELLLGAGFLLIVSGATLFGLLLTRPARRLGDISYGIYLLQGPVLLLAFSLPGLRAASVSSPAVHWGLVAIAAAALTAFATLTHSLVERPGIKAGRWASRRVAAALGDRADTAEPSVLIDRKEPRPQSY